MNIDAYLTFIEKFENPDIQEKLKTAYQIGYMAAMEEIKEPLLSLDKWNFKVLDLGLPSGTKWIRLANQNHDTTFTRYSAIKEGFQLPTMAQCEELAHCRFEFDQYDGNYHRHIIGPNGVIHGLYYGWVDTIKFYLWPSDGMVDIQTLQMEAFILEGQYPAQLVKRIMSLTEKGFSLFVLPDDKSIQHN